MTDIHARVHEDEVRSRGGCLEMYRGRVTLDNHEIRLTDIHARVHDDKVGSRGGCLEMYRGRVALDNHEIRLTDIHARVHKDEVGSRDGCVAENVRHVGQNPQQPAFCQHAVALDVRGVRGHVGQGCPLVGEPFDVVPKSPRVDGLLIFPEGCRDGVGGASNREPAVHASPERDGPRSCIRAVRPIPNVGCGRSVTVRFDEVAFIDFEPLEGPGPRRQDVNPERRRPADPEHTILEGPVLRVLAGRDVPEHAAVTVLEPAALNPHVEDVVHELDPVVGPGRGQRGVIEGAADHMQAIGRGGREDARGRRSSSRRPREPQPAHEHVRGRNGHEVERPRARERVAGLRIARQADDLDTRQRHRDGRGEGLATARLAYDGVAGRRRRESIRQRGLRVSAAEAIVPVGAIHGVHVVDIPEWRCLGNRAGERRFLFSHLALAELSHGTPLRVLRAPEFPGRSFSGIAYTAVGAVTPLRH